MSATVIITDSDAGAATLWSSDLQDMADVVVRTNLRLTNADVDYLDDVTAALVVTSRDAAPGKALAAELVGMGISATARHLRGWSSTLTGQGTVSLPGGASLATSPPPGSTRRKSLKEIAGKAAATKGKAAKAVDDDSWEPVDMSVFLADDYEPPKGELLLRTDGVGLLYKGKTHSFHGESESGKSLIAQAEAARVLLGGGSVVFIDYEDSPDNVGNRIRAFGVPRQILTDRERFLYVRPEKGPGQKFRRLLDRPWDLAIIDGVTHSLATMQLGSQGDTDIATWQDALPKPLAKHTGAAVVVVDHVNKSADSRGRFATGSQHKMSGLTGAGYVVEPLDVLRMGVGGRVRMSVAKDRPGGVRRHLGDANAHRMQVAAVVEFDSTGEVTTWQVVPPENADAPLDSLEKENKAGEMPPLEWSGLDPARGMYVVLSVLAGEDGLNQTGGVSHYRNLRKTLNSREDAAAAWKAAEQAEAFEKIVYPNGNPTRYRTADPRHPFATEEPVRKAIRDLEKKFQAGELSGLRPVSQGGDDAPE